MATFTGPAQVSVFRAIAVKAAIGLHMIGLTPNRQWTRKAALAAATSYTGKTYKQGQQALAHADLSAWLEDQRKVQS